MPRMDDALSLMCIKWKATSSKCSLLAQESGGQEEKRLDLYLRSWCRKNSSERWRAGKALYLKPPKNYKNQNKNKNHMLPLKALPISKEKQILWREKLRVPLLIFPSEAAESFLSTPEDEPLAAGVSPFGSRYRWHRLPWSGHFSLVPLVAKVNFWKKSREMSKAVCSTNTPLYEWRFLTKIKVGEKKKNTQDLLSERNWCLKPHCMATKMQPGPTVSASLWAWQKCKSPTPHLICKSHSGMWGPAAPGGKSPPAILTPDWVHEPLTAWSSGPQPWTHTRMRKLQEKGRKERS